MSTKWLSKLSEEELIKLHEYILSEGTNIVAGIEYIENDGYSVSITFLENGWEDIEGPLENYYEFEDFKGIQIYDWSTSTSIKGYTQRFREWMIDRFGVEYLDELIKEILGLNLVDYLDWSKKEGWKKYESKS